MFGFAWLLPVVPGPRLHGVLSGLMLTAVAVVAQAICSMSGSLAPDRSRRLIALSALAALVLVRGASTQFTVLLASALAGALLRLPDPGNAVEIAPRAGQKPAWGSLSIFAVLLACAWGSALSPSRNLTTLAGIFYRSGSLVFGGGHVVLPLLQQALVPTGWVANDRFLAGYGFAQAIPGPLFSFSGYLGAACAPTGQSLLWASVALVSIFLPGLLLAIAGREVLGRMSRGSRLRASLAGVGAGVVGLLAAALYEPIGTSAIHSPVDVLIALVAFVALQVFKVPPIGIALGCILASVTSS
jgi:chromate transporter